MVQNPDQRDLTGNTVSTPLMSVSSRVDIKIDQERIEETLNVESFEDGYFPALRPNYDRNAHTHRSQI